MKKIIHSFLAFCTLLFLISFNGCDELQSLPLNIPIPIYFSTSGSNSSTTVSEFFCFSDSQEWQDNMDKIKKATFISAAYWTESVTPANLSGNIVATLMSGGQTVFSIPFPGATPGNYINNPLTLELNQSQIDFLNSLLDNLVNNDKCFEATLNITNISGFTEDYELNGRIELLIEAEVDFN